MVLLVLSQSKEKSSQTDLNILHIHISYLDQTFKAVYKLCRLVKYTKKTCLDGSLE